MNSIPKLRFRFENSQQPRKTKKKWNWEENKLFIWSDWVKEFFILTIMSYSWNVGRRKQKRGTEREWALLAVFWWKSTFFCFAFEGFSRFYYSNSAGNEIFVQSHFSNLSNMRRTIRTRMKKQTINEWKWKKGKKMKKN